MPRPSRGPRLWLRAPRRRERDGSVEQSVWIIRDQYNNLSTRFGPDARAEAEMRLAAYITAKYRPARRERELGEIPLADVIAIYLADVAPGQAAAHCDRLLDYFGKMTLADVTGASCREWRQGKGPKVKGGRKGAGGGARRDLQDLGAAIGRCRRRARRASDGFRGRNSPSCWGRAGGRARRRKGNRPRVAPCVTCRDSSCSRSTGSRPSATLAASWLIGPRRSHIDLDNGVFHSRGNGVAETTKRQPTVKLAPRLQAHLRRWHAADLNAGRAHFVMFDGAPVASVKTALARAVKLAELPAGGAAYTLRHTGSRPCDRFMLRP